MQPATTNALAGILALRILPKSEYFFRILGNMNFEIYIRNSYDSNVYSK